MIEYLIKKWIKSKNKDSYGMRDFVRKLKKPTSKMASENLIGSIPFDGIKFDVTNVFWKLFLVESQNRKWFIFSSVNRYIWEKHNLPKTVWFFLSEKSPDYKINSECAFGWYELTNKPIHVFSFRGISYKTRKIK